MPGVKQTVPVPEEKREQIEIIVNVEVQNYDLMRIFVLRLGGENRGEESGDPAVRFFSGENGGRKEKDAV